MKPNIQAIINQFCYDAVYQVAPGEHTMSACSEGCGRSSRGGRMCLQCLTKRFAKDVDKWETKCAPKS